ncbi:MAG: hypothetical protein GY851_24830 [bacterium]|nr:hypothetical protein [bacterium]
MNLHVSPRLRLAALAVPLVFVAASFGTTSLPVVRAASGAASPQASPLPAERVAPPTMYSPSVERYRFGVPDVSNRAFYPIQHKPVDRSTYMSWLEEQGLSKLADSPALGLEGPRCFMPVLAKYVQTGDRRWGEAIVTMLKDWHRATLEEVAEKGWTEQFIEEPAFIPVYRKYLIAGGLMSEEEAWFRDLWLDYCRNLHVWASEPIEWRGGCHRSMPEGLAKGLAAKWYPDIPEAAHWTRYAALVFGDFWKHKEVPQNDTGYFPGPIFMLLCCGDQYLGDDRAVTHPGMQRLWRRLTDEVTPDGAVNPYGPNGGWNSTAGFRLFALELAGTKTGNGKYRYAAHKVMNYMEYQSDAMRKDRYLLERESGQHVALAWLVADDSVKPVPPSAGSLWNKRTEAVRLPHTDADLTERLLGNADPAPNRGHLCCSWYITGREWPDKLILRSGWNPGDLFALVELHPTSFPANPGGIMGLTRWGAPFTQIVTSKGGSQENRLMIEDVEGSAKCRYHPDPLRIDEEWRRGRMPDIQSEMTYFEDRSDATFARVRVQNMDGLPVVYEREFVFVKNRFLATRETVTFEESFTARVAPLWNTRNIGPQIGVHWANTFLGAPVASNGQIEMETPPVDLLVWFAPREDCRLQVVDRFLDDPRTEVCPAQVRYLWEGRPAEGDKVTFTQVYYPHQPYRARANTNNPGAKAIYGDDLQATACAAGIRAVRDDVEATVLRFEMEPGRIEWVVFNPLERNVEADSLQTKRPYDYIHPGRAEQ